MGLMLIPLVRLLGQDALRKLSLAQVPQVFGNLWITLLRPRIVASHQAHSPTTFISSKVKALQRPRSTIKGVTASAPVRRAGGVSIEPARLIGI